MRMCARVFAAAAISVIMLAFGVFTGSRTGYLDVSPVYADDCTWSQTGTLDPCEYLFQVPAPCDPECIQPNQGIRYTFYAYACTEDVDRMTLRVYYFHMGQYILVETVTMAQTANVYQWVGATTCLLSFGSTGPIFIMDSEIPLYSVHVHSTCCTLE